MNDRERLEQRAEALDVTVKSLWDCEHPSSLIYFDRLYGSQWSWEVCEHCGTKHHEVELKAPDEDRSLTDDSSYYDSRGFHYYREGSDL